MVGEGRTSFGYVDSFDTETVEKWPSRMGVADAWMMCGQSMGRTMPEQIIFSIATRRHSGFQSTPNRKKRIIQDLTLLGIPGQSAKVVFLFT